MTEKTEKVGQSEITTTTVETKAEVVAGTPVPEVVLSPEEARLVGLHDAVAHLRKGGTLSAAVMDDLLLYLGGDVLNQVKPAVERIGREVNGALHVMEYNPVTGAYDVDLGVAAVSPLTVLHTDEPKPAKVTAPAIPRHK